MDLNFIFKISSQKKIMGFFCLGVLYKQLPKFNEELRIEPALLASSLIVFSIFVIYMLKF